MSGTLIYNNRASRIEALRGDGDDLWLTTDDLRSATGWEIKAEGACLGDQCVPIPRGREDEFLAVGSFNLGALAVHLDQPLVHDAGHAVWVFGQSTLRSGYPPDEAADFTLPDLDGTAHSLSDHRGKKVFLVSWASW